MNIITTISMMMIAMTTTTFRFQLSRPIEPTSQFEAKVREFNPR